MFIAGLDTGETTGLVVVDEAGEVRKRMSSKEQDEILMALGQYGDIIVVLERAPKTQEEYINFKFSLGMYGYPIAEVSPGEWKPNPQCKTPAKDTPGWTQHERDALSLTKYYRLSRARAKDQIRRP